jgi:hypothetical protein
MKQSTCPREPPRIVLSGEVQHPPVADPVQRRCPVVALARRVSRPPRLVALGEHGADVLPVHEVVGLAQREHVGRCVARAGHVVPVATDVGVDDRWIRAAEELLAVADGLSLCRRRRERHPQRHEDQPAPHVSLNAAIAETVRLWVGTSVASAVSWSERERGKPGYAPHQPRNRTRGALSASRYRHLRVRRSPWRARGCPREPGRARAAASGWDRRCAARRRRAPGGRG